MASERKGRCCDLGHAARPKSLISGVERLFLKGRGCVSKRRADRTFSVFRDETRAQIALRVVFGRV